MARSTGIENDVRDRRARLGWTQRDLASRSGLSRAGVGAIEAGKLVPSTSAALALAAAMGCRVEDLFRLPGAETGSPSWAWSPVGTPGRYWRASVGGRARLYPVEPSPLGMTPHDGLWRDGALEEAGESDPTRTLVMATCDPAVGLLASELARSSGIRLIVFGRSSQSALAMLKDRSIHAAGLHLSRSSDPDGNLASVRDSIGPGHVLIRVARWEEGVVCAPGLGLASAREAARSKRRWVGRETGSGARECFDELTDGQRPPRRMARDHRGVAEAIRCGWADLGVSLRLTGEEAGLDFLGVREEAYDLCFPEEFEDDPRIRALVQAVRSRSYGRSLAALPGVDATTGGEIVRMGDRGAR
jgi:molybdate-binding protein/DNA-binding XRE family transcriptional regulator